MKNFFIIFLLITSSFICFSQDYDPWAGANVCKILKIDVTSGDNFGFRVVTDAVDLLNDKDVPAKTSWAYLNESDSNYKTYVSLLTMAFFLEHKVTIYVRNVNGYAHIGYIQVHK